MCGRFALYSSGDALERRFIVRIPEPLEARYNIAPSQSVCVVRCVGPDGQCQWGSLRWGLLPAWAKDPRLGYKMINARAETVAEKPAFRHAYRHRRCLIPANGFYEWARAVGGKQPYYIRMADEELFAFAGLWERWSGPDGGPVETCAIITTAADDWMRPLHERMPLILRTRDHARWLDPTSPADDLQEVLQSPERAPAMVAVPVSSRVNSPRNDGPDLLQASPANV